MKKFSRMSPPLSLRGVRKTAESGTHRFRWRRHRGKDIGGDIANKLHQLAAFAGFWPAQCQGRYRPGILKGTITDIRQRDRAQGFGTKVTPIPRETIPIATATSRV